MKMVAFALVLFTIVPPASAQDDGPFGLRLGMSRAELLKLVGKPIADKAGQIQVGTVPKPHPAFESYALIVSPTHGLCKIMAIGLNITLNSFGDRLKSTFAETAAALDEKYGKHESYDYLQAGSIWKEPQDWAMALLKEERVLAASWKPAPVTDWDDLP